MAKWLKRFLVFTGFTLLLYHNVRAHHHDDDDNAIEHSRHHPHDPLEHVKIDHHFYQDLQKHFNSTLAAVTILPQFVCMPQPVATVLPGTVWLPADEPDPPGWYYQLPVLRGPPSLVNTAV